MDDIWVFGQDSMMLRLLQLDLQELLRRRGLNMNTGKTEVLEGQELLERAREIEHSAVDGALEGDAPDLGPLQQLVDKLLARPEVASRTSLRFATTRIRSHEAYELVPAFVEAALRLPHAADHLARMLRDSEIWRELGEWYVENSRRYNHSLTWTMYHLGTMFPSDEKPSDALVQYWIEDLVKGDLPLLHVPLAAQRLSAWDAQAARAAIREAARQPAYQHPFVTRALALAGRSAGVSPTDVRQLLGQFAETDVTHKFLAARSMKAVKPAPDFAGL